MYVYYSYYIEKYCGDVIPEEDFTWSERKAESYIRHLTFYRGDIFNEESESVKDAVCAVAEVYYCTMLKNNHGEHGPVKSENTDGYSVTYAAEQVDGQTIEELTRKKAYDAAYPYLLPTGWLSRRVVCSSADKHGCDCL